MPTFILQKQKLISRKEAQKQKIRFKKRQKRQSSVHRFLYIDRTSHLHKFRSSWEALYAQYLDSLNYTWYYERRKFRVPGYGYYLPDFYVKELNEWHEVKGYLRKNSAAKMAAFQEIYTSITLKLISKKEMLELGLLQEN